MNCIGKFRRPFCAALPQGEGLTPHPPSGPGEETTPHPSSGLRETPDATFPSRGRLVGNISRGMAPYEKTEYVKMRSDQGIAPYEEGKRRKYYGRNNRDPDAGN